MAAVVERDALPLGPYRMPGAGRDGVLRRLGVAAGDLAYVKLVGRLAGLGRRATEDEVRAFFEQYEEYAGLAGVYALRIPS